MAQIIKATGEQIEVEPRNGTDFQLDELQKIVGGFIEVVWLRGDKLMVVNEMGKINGLPINSKASRIVCLYSKYHTTDIIVGDVLYCNKNQVL